MLPALFHRSLTVVWYLDAVLPAEVDAEDVPDLRRVPAAFVPERTISEACKECGVNPIRVGPAKCLDCTLFVGNRWVAGRCARAVCLLGLA